MAKRTFQVWRGNNEGGEFKTFDVDVDPGMVVLDVLHRIQAQQANDLALRWNCKAGKCGSCSIHSMRPEHCRNFPVGGADCRATVLRRRPSEASAIFAAMPGFATSVADSAKRGQSAGAEPGTYPGPAAAGNGA